jgi:hypothetical protein
VLAIRLGPAGRAKASLSRREEAGDAGQAASRVSDELAPAAGDV